MSSSLFVYTTHVLTRTGIDDRACVAGSRGTRSWAEFYRAVNGWKLAFTSCGSSRVAVYFGSLFDSAAALFGAWAAGCTAVLPADTSKMMCDALIESGITAFAGDFPPSDRVNIVSCTPDGNPCKDVIPEDREWIEIFTSGSTGTPTRVVKKLRQLFCEVQSIETRHHGGDSGVPEHTLIVSTVSQQHIYGLLFYLLWSFSAARTAWEKRIEYPEELLGVFAKNDSCAWIASPAHLKRLPEELDWSAAKDNLEVVYSSGGPLPEDGLRKTIALTGLSPVELLGSSESGGIAWRSRKILENGEIDGASLAWHPLPSVEWRDENGLLVIKSPQLSSDGWESTSDRIEVCPDGESFMHLGRTDRIVKIEEKRVSLTNLENTLKASGLVLEAKAFQLPDARKSLSILAVPSAEGVAMIRAGGKKNLVDRLRTILLGSVERVCLPRYWRFAHAIPENSMGKNTVAKAAELFDERAVQFVAESLSEGRATVLISVPPKSPFFEGHFPEFAILPGLAQINWAIETAERIFKFTPEFRGLKNMKFMQPILPGSTVEGTLAFNAEKRELEFVLKAVDGSVHAKGKVLV